MDNFRASFGRWCGIAAGVMAGVSGTALALSILWSIFLYVAAKGSDVETSYYELVVRWSQWFLPWGLVGNLFL